MVWETILDVGGDILDFLGDNPYVGETLARLIADNPELDYDKLLELAIQNAVINSPDIETPYGATIWDVDPETGKRSGSQTLSPEMENIKNLAFAMASSPSQAYAAPESMRGPMLSKYMNSYEQRLGLPLSDYQAPTFARNFDVPPMVTPEEEDEDETTAPVLAGPDRPGNIEPGESGSGTNPVYEDAMSQADFEESLNLYLQQNQDIFNDPNFDAMNFDLDRSIEEFLGNTGPGPTTGFKAWAIDHADEAAKLLGAAASAATGVKGLGSGFGWVTDWLVDTFFYGRGGSLYNPIPEGAPTAEDVLGPGGNTLIDEALDPWQGNPPQMSPIPQPVWQSTLLPGGTSTHGSARIDAMGQQRADDLRKLLGLAPTGIIEG